MSGIGVSGGGAGVSSVGWKVAVVPVVSRTRYDEPQQGD